MASENQPPTVISTKQTPEEEHNIAVAKEYMSIAYSPTENKGAESVRHLCTADSWFWSPSTFPGCSTPMDYAESHARVMASVNDLHIVRYDQAWAKDGHVLLRYTAEGQDGALRLSEIEDGKVKSFTKDWDQKVMQIQLGWAPVGESKDPRWDPEMLAQPELARDKK
ncbi:hypothetical protein AFGD_006218 [Aspergillus flavus]|nr:hypothetical protein AFGD_006218 [Aspergillus flavus]